jgi:glycosyltransferase involved in cell wall biosynthesis
VSNCEPLKRVVEETGAGVVFEAEDPQSLAAAMRALLDPDARRRCGAAGRRAVETRYNWDVDGAALVEFIARTARLESRESSW